MHQRCAVVTNDSEEDLVLKGEGRATASHGT